MKIDFVNEKKETKTNITLKKTSFQSEISSDLGKLIFFKSS